MKRIVTALCGLLLFSATGVWAQSYGNGPFQFQNRDFFVSGCASYTPPQPLPPSGYATCTDTVTGVRYFWNGTKFATQTQCTWSITAYGGAAALTSNVACLSQYSHVAYVNQNTNGSATAVVTPAATNAPQFACAQTAANSTTVACLGVAGAPTTVIYGWGY